MTERRPSALAVPLGRGAARPRSLVASWALRVGTAAALAIDAAVHLQNASGYDAVKATVSQGALFRAEAGVAVAAALLVLVRPRRSSWVAALLVAASALGAVLLYRYVDVGQLGPLPNMYENTWQVPGKLLSAWAEGAAVVLAGLGLLTHRGAAPTRTADSRASGSEASSGTTPANSTRLNPVTMRWEWVQGSASARRMLARYRDVHRTITATNPLTGTLGVRVGVHNAPEETPDRSEATDNR